MNETRIKMPLPLYRGEGMGEASAFQNAKDTMTCSVSTSVLDSQTFFYSDQPLCDDTYSLTATYNGGK